MRFTSAHIRFFCLSNSLHHSLFPSAKPSLSLPLPVVAEHQEYNCAHNRKDQDAAGYSGQNPRNAAIRHVLRRRNDRGHQVAGRIGAPLRAAPIGRLVGHEHIPAARPSRHLFHAAHSHGRGTSGRRCIFPFQGDKTRRPVGTRPLPRHAANTGIPVPHWSRFQTKTSVRPAPGSAPPPAVRRRWSRPPGNRTSFPPLQRFPLRPPAPAGPSAPAPASRERSLPRPASSLCTFQAPCS